MYWFELLSFVITRSRPLVRERVGFLRSCMTIVMNILNVCSLFFIEISSWFCTSFVITRSCNVEIECWRYLLLIMLLIMHNPSVSSFLSSSLGEFVLLFIYDNFCPVLTPPENSGKRSDCPFFKLLYILLLLCILTNYSCLFSKTNSFCF